MKGLEFVFLGLGGILGTFLRYKLLESQLLFNFIPLNTLIVNILGSFILGIFIVSSIHFNIDGKYALFIAVGFCGSLTTFSAFALDNYNLIKSNDFFNTILYITLSVAGCIIMVYAGFYIIQKILN